MTTSQRKPSVGLWSAVVAVGIALAALAVFQWHELKVIRDGGSAICAMSEHINCETVWNSPFASMVHHFIRMPIAVLGLVWALAVAVLGGLAVWAASRGKSTLTSLRGLEILAAVGVLTSIVLAIVSAQAGAVCLTCLGTYVGVLVLGVLALKLQSSAPRIEVASLGKGAFLAGGVTVALYLALLVPSLKITPPKENEAKKVEGAAAESGTDAEKLQRLYAELTPEQRSSMGAFISRYTQTPPMDRSAFPVRELYGPADAPVKVLEFTNILCPHCAQFFATLQQLKASVPPGRLSVEPRQFPLDKECNPQMQGTDNSGVRCLAAKVQICLEGRPQFWGVVAQFFESQASLSRDLIFQIVVRAGISRDDMERCVAADDTAAKLREDIALAMRFKPQGTPLVVVNGRDVGFRPLALYTLAVTSGDLTSPVLQQAMSTATR